jgi:hypothetical protein
MPSPKLTGQPQLERCLLEARRGPAQPTDLDDGVANPQSARPADFDVARDRDAVEVQFRDLPERRLQPAAHGAADEVPVGVGEYVERKADREAADHFQRGPSCLLVEVDPRLPGRPRRRRLAVEQRHFHPLFADEQELAVGQVRGRQPSETPAVVRDGQARCKRFRQLDLDRRLAGRDERQPLAADEAESRVIQLHAHAVQAASPEALHESAKLLVEHLPDRAQQIVEGTHLLQVEPLEQSEEGIRRGTREPPPVDGRTLDRIAQRALLRIAHHVDGGDATRDDNPEQPREREDRRHADSDIAQQQRLGEIVGQRAGRVGRERIERCRGVDSLNRRVEGFGALDCRFERRMRGGDLRGIVVLAQRNGHLHEIGLDGVEVLSQAHGIGADESVQIPAIARQQTVERHGIARCGEQGTRQELDLQREVS